MIYEKAKELFDSGDYGAALNAYKGLAEGGCARSKTYLGWMYQEGIGAPKDLHEAERWYGEAAGLGYPEAQFRLAKIYARKGERDRSIEFYERAAAKDYPPALYRLGWIYETGKGVPRDKLKAISFYRKSALQGHVFAKKQLGIFLIQGVEGFGGRIRGLIFLLSAIVSAVSISLKDQYDQRLLD